MKITKKLCLAALFVVLAAGGAEARGKPGSGGGGTPTNYGCQTFKAGTIFYSADFTSQKSLLTSTYGCYLCNMTTKVCAMQSPTSLVGWYFRLP